jgi:hypothetical protein
VSPFDLRSFSYPFGHTILVSGCIELHSSFAFIVRIQTSKPSIADTFSRLAIAYFLFYRHFAVYCIHFRSARTSVLSYSYIGAPVQSLVLRVCKLYTRSTVVSLDCVNSYIQAFCRVLDSLSIHPNVIISARLYSIWYCASVHYIQDQPSRLSTYALSIYISPITYILYKIDSRVYWLHTLYYISVRTVFDTTISLLYISLYSIRYYDQPYIYKASDYPNTVRAYIYDPTKRHYFITAL